jgi:hypothetical protein
MKRLMESDASEFERGLLDALKLERPSAELEQRMRAAIGLDAVPAPAPSLPASPAAPAAKTFGVWSAIAAGSVVAALVAGGGAMMDGDEAPVDTPEAPAVVAPTEPEGPRPTPLSELAPEAPAPAVDRPNTTPRAPQKTTSSGASASLREEIRLIDSARLAVKKNDGARALGILDQYARRFPDGTFQEEARVLRAEALKARPSPH